MHCSIFEAAPQHCFHSAVLSKHVSQCHLLLLFTFDFFEMAFRRSFLRDLSSFSVLIVLVLLAHSYYQQDGSLKQFHDDTFKTSAKLESLNEAIAEKDVELSNLKENLADSTQLAESQKLEISKLRDDISKLRVAVDGKDGDISKLKTSLADLETARIKADEVTSMEIGNLQGQVTTLKSAVAAKEVSLSKTEQQLAEINHVSKSKSDEVNELKKIVSTLEAQVTTKNNQISDIQGQLSESKAVAQSKSDEVSKLEKEINDCERDLESAQEKLSILQEESRKTISSLEASIKGLESNNAAAAPSN
jgi:chromosome segregation ATPase